MIVFPPAKINIGLSVLFKRNDGFHEIESVLYPIPLYDVLELLPAATFSFRSSGLPISGSEESNLCIRAYELMKKRFEIGGVYMHLLKNIPMGAGLGGGSADAAYVIKGLNELFQLNLTVNEMRDLAGELGSDCPFFIEAKPAFATGRGECLRLLPLDLKGKYIKVIKPEVHTSTADAYSLVSKSPLRSIENALARGIDQWKDVLFNAFEIPFFAFHPEMKGIKEELYGEGAFYASLTGSGSAFYGLFEHKPSAQSNFGSCHVLQLN